MKFLLDENVERRPAPFLQALGHDVTVVGVDYFSSLSDHEVLVIAYKERRILITNDRSDFGELIFRRKHPHCDCGVILFRIRSGDLAIKQAYLRHLLTQKADQLNQFMVITKKGVRIRRAVEREAA